ncbi:MAG: prolyl oligopeptidase family serine peptidase [Planctomycetaceae bacterium]|nr:prolyl oligopeptidase family serine peptidase [Planctomycetaceae bacterium]
MISIDNVILKLFHSNLISLLRRLGIRMFNRCRPIKGDRLGQISRSDQLRGMSILFVVCWSLAGASRFVQAEVGFDVPKDVIFRQADITSEGTRMAAEVFLPRDVEGRLPTIIMSHGWGGTAEALRPDAIVFAQAGFLVVTFDYRGWGNSAARLISTAEPTEKDGKLIAEVVEVRGVVDPVDQTTDIMNAIHWVQGEPRCDQDRIGIWGSSFSGGHVVYVAARDPRVKAFVSQVGAMDARWAIQIPQLRKLVFQQGMLRSRGRIGYPEPFANFNNMRGQPVWEKLMRYAPIEDIGRCENCAKLFIIAENEELFDNEEHAILAHQRATGVKKLATIRGIKHYGIYREKRHEAQQLAIDWFNQYLKPKPAGKSKSVEQQGVIERRTKVHRLANQKRSLFDAFVYVNRVPEKPAAGETAVDVAGRIFGRLANQEGRVLLKLPPGMDQQAYEGLKVFLRSEGEQSVGNCQTCHSMPDFTDLKQHHTNLEKTPQLTPSLRNLGKTKEELRAIIRRKVKAGPESTELDPGDDALEYAKMRIDDQDIEQLTAFLCLLDDVTDKQFRQLILKSSVLETSGTIE